MGTEFNEQITYYNGLQDTNISTTFLAVDTYTNLKFNPENIVNSFHTISFNPSTSSFIINTLGIFLVQFRLSITGGANDQYTTIMSLNNKNLRHTQQTFTTKGANIWEVQSLALLDLTAIPTSSSFGQSRNQIRLQIKNDTDTSTIILKNSSVVIIKIQ